jgi:hypothetical protein
MEKQPVIVTLTLYGCLVIGAMAAASATAASVYDQRHMPPPSNATELESEAAAERAFQEAAALADIALKKARSVDGEWPQTNETLKKALTAAAAGDYQVAIQLVETVRTKSEEGYQEAVARQEAEKEKAKQEAAAAAAKQQAQEKAQAK